MGKYAICFCVFVLFHMPGCAIPSADIRNRTAEQMAEKAGWTKTVFKTRVFDITGFRPDRPSAPQSVMAIYIEGDGLAWVSRSRVSKDPTPVNPLGLSLAFRHPNDNVLYLSRPFQYGQDRNKESRFWTSARFAPRVIEAYSQILDQLKQRCKVSQFHLVGYSGGGAIAALVAARRKDIALLVTVSGNLDHRTWTSLHGISPLTESLNPADFSESLMHIPQIHFYGKEDELVPGKVAMAFCDRFPPEKYPRIIGVQGVNHFKGWIRLWPGLLLDHL